MTVFTSRRALRCGVSLALALAVNVLAGAPTTFAADPMPTSATGNAVLVHLDQARILKLPERTATLVVGNPLIADAVVQSGSVVVTAKSYGATNLVALDRSGATLAHHVIQVVGPADRIVVVYRGVDRESYSCMPSCERRITIGDTPAYFTANLGQLGAFSAQAIGQPAPK